jgi:hypothetical protein
LLTGALALAATTLLTRTAMKSARDRDRAQPIDGDDRSRGCAPGVPIWLKLGYGVATPIIAGVYWRAYGPKNFLWLSDIALASTTLGVIGENRLLASMPAVGVLPLEAAWNVDFLSGGKALGLAGYMFDRRLPRSLRALSLFHLALPPTLIWVLARLGYDRRALGYQTILTWSVLPLSYALTKPEQNVNWVLGPGREPQHLLPPLLYLGLEMLALPALVFLPMHLILDGAFGTPNKRTRRDVNSDSCRCRNASHASTGRPCTPRGGRPLRYG